MKTLTLILTIFLLTASVALACGIKPIKPIKPIGCETQHAICIDGRWVWVCS